MEVAIFLAARGRSIERIVSREVFRSRIKLDGEADGEYSLFEFNPCFAAGKRRALGDFKFRLRSSAVRAEPMGRTFAIFVRLHGSCRNNYSYTCPLIVHTQLILIL